MLEEIIHLDGINVNYKTGGIGPCVLILHGWGGSSDSWQLIGEALVKNNYKVIIPDLPGFGKSDFPVAIWSVGDYLDFILKFIEELKSLEKISEPLFLIGHSFGGRISIKFAAISPKKIKKVILCSAAGIIAKRGIKIRTFNFFAKIGKSIFSFGCLVSLKALLRKALYRVAGSGDYLRANPQMKEVMKKVISEDLTGFLPKINVPTLIIWGENDKVLSVKDGRLMQKRIIGSKINIIENVGHAPNIESPEKLAKLILDWFSK
jgi:pimeloyl-ACP methyl ester carboxylesterase